MSKRKINAGSTGITIPVQVLDYTSSVGAGLAGLVFNTSGLVAEYRRQGEAAFTAMTLQAATLGTWTTRGWVAAGALAGRYEFGVPDAVLASGARWAEIAFYGAPSMVPVVVEIELDAVNYQDATAFGLSRLDAAISSRLAGASYTAQTGDAYARLGAPAGASVSADLAAAKAILDAWNLLEIVGGTVNDVAPTASGFVGSSGLSATDGFYVGRLVCFTNGPLAGLKQAVTGYTGATKTFAFSTPFPAAPANTNAFVII